MTEEVKLKITINGDWQVGYHQVHDKLFLYRIDDDGLVTVMNDGRIDSVFFIEYTNYDNWVELGEL